MERRISRQIDVGGILIGGGAPVSVQSMLNTDTHDVAACTAQIKRLHAAGCDIVRLAVPDMAAAYAFAKIREASPLPLVADIHFDYRLAVECARGGADKIRINPGNIGSTERVRTVARECAKRKIPIRIGVNGGSLEKEILAKYNAPTAEALCESALSHIKMLEEVGFYDIAVSVKSSDVETNVAAYRMLAKTVDYPLHLGVTEAGTALGGTVKNSMGIGALLLSGIGDTLRVSLTAPPEEEVFVGNEILRTLNLRNGVKFVSCPTCGRCKVDMLPVAREIEARVRSLNKSITVAVMGCAVNGPGEARGADIGIACGDGVALIFRRGEILRKVPIAVAADELLKEAQRL